jgi:hypothetical protein
MRSDLMLLRQAGISTARFMARFAGISGRGFPILTDILSPIGESEHAWMPRDSFRRLPPRGATISFVADITDYGRDDGSSDLTLCNPRCLEVLV